MTSQHQYLDSNVIPPMRKLPIAAWSITYGIHQDALVNYYDALVECLWQKEVNNTLAKDTGSKKGIEKLFRRKR